MDNNNYTIWPNWGDNFAIPTVGDDVIIVKNDVITINEKDLNTTKSFEINIQPKSKYGILTERAKNIAILIKKANNLTNHFVRSYSDFTSNKTELKIDLYILLILYRSILEYTAHYIASFCSNVPQEKSIQFPIAKTTDDKNKFQNNLKRWFPGLENNKPKLFDYLLSIQNFSGEPWLSYLSDLSNELKHRALLNQEVKEFDVVEVSWCKIRILIGDLGLQSIKTNDNGILKFKNIKGDSVEIKAPFVISMNKIDTPNKDVSIKIIKKKRKMYYMSNYDQSTMHIVSGIGKNIFRVVHNINALLS